jgi:hypothetical protein
MCESGFSNYIRNVTNCVSGVALGAVRLLSPGTMRRRKIRKSLFLLSLKPILMHCFETGGVWREVFSCTNSTAEVTIM